MMSRNYHFEIDFYPKSGLTPAEAFAVLDVQKNQPSARFPKCCSFSQKMLAVVSVLSWKSAQIEILCAGSVYSLDLPYWNIYITRSAQSFLIRSYLTFLERRKLHIAKVSCFSLAKDTRYKPLELASRNTESIATQSSQVIQKNSIGLYLINKLFKWPRLHRSYLNRDRKFYYRRKIRNCYFKLSIFKKGFKISSKQSRRLSSSIGTRYAKYKSDSPRHYNWLGARDILALKK